MTTTAPLSLTDEQIVEDLEFEPPCQITIRRTGTVCQASAEWAIITTSHCAPDGDPDGRRPVAGLVCRKHLDWVMAGLPVRMEICGHRVDDLRPFILRIEAL